MKKYKLLLLAVASMALASCGKGEEDASSLTMYCWSTASINSAKKTGSPIYKKIKENSNVDLIAKSISSGGYDEAINKLFNTGELPDVFVIYGPERPNQYKKMIENEDLVSLTRYATEDKYPNLYRHMQNYKYLENLYYADGQQWSIPTNFSLEHSLYVRLDWIDNLNKTSKLTSILTEELGHTPNEQELETYKFKSPETILDFYRLARAFTKYDPDENGRNDTYGYSSTDDMWSDNWIHIAFSGGYQMMVNENGSYVPSDVADATKNAILFLNKLNTEGIMHPDWQTDKFDDKQNKFAQGSVGMMECHNWYNNIVSSFHNAHQNISIEECAEKIGMINPPKGQTGKSGIIGHPGFWTCVGINAQMGNAKINAALKLFDYLYSDECQTMLVDGIEGEHYQLDASGKKESLMGVDTSGFNYTLASYDACYPITSFCNWTANYFSPYANNAEKIIHQMNEAKEYAVIEDHPFTQTPSYVNYFEGMTDYSETTFLNMITNKSFYTETASKTQIATWENLLGSNSSFDSAWNSFKNKYLGDYHGSQVINEYNEAIAKLN